MKYQLLLLLMVFSHFVQATSETLTLKKNNQTVKVLSLKDLNQTNTTTLIVDNLSNSKITNYQGVLLTTVLHQVFGDDWKQAEAIKFIAEDDYRVIIPTTLIKRHTGFIATGEVGEKGFKPIQRKKNPFWFI